MAKRIEVEQIIFNRTNSLCFETLKAVKNLFEKQVNGQITYSERVSEMVNATIKQVLTVRSMEIGNENIKIGSELPSFKKRHN